jgi:thioredoxin reductase
MPLPCMLRDTRRSVIFGANFGGETATGGLIENYPGAPAIDGYELMTNFRTQTDAYDVPVVNENIMSILRTDDCFEATTESGEVFVGSSVILGVGRERRMRMTGWGAECLSARPAMRHFIAVTLWRQ